MDDAALTPPSTRWFTDDELKDMARPTMDRAIDAIDRGDLDEARALCETMKSEWISLHDMMVEVVAALITYVQQTQGDEGVAAAWGSCHDKMWRHHHDAILACDRRDIVGLLAATWRAHSGSGTGRNPASFTVTEDDEKITFEMHPCGSGQRLVLRGRYDGPNAYGTTNEAHDWSFGRADFPLYCTHCSFMNELMPLRWVGSPLYPSEPPIDFHTDPCTWYWYKDADDIDP